MNRLQTRRSCVRVVAVERYADAALGVDTSGGGPVDVVGTDNASTSADQGVGDPAVAIAVATDRQDGAGVQDENGYAGRASLHRRYGARHQARVGGLWDRLTRA